MQPSAKLLVLWLIASALVCPVFAQTGDEPEQRIDLAEVRRLRAQAEADAALGDELRASILELYDSAISAFESAAAHTAEVAEFERERAGVGRMVDALRTELDRPDPLLPTDPLQGLTTEQAENKLARERSRTAAYRSALRDAERLAEERSKTRNEIAQKLGELDNEIESLNDDLRNLSERDLHAEEKRAARANLTARRERAVRRIDALRAQLGLLDTRGILIPWKIDQAQRRVDHGEQFVDQLYEATRLLRRRGIDKALREALDACRLAAERSPELAGIAAETEGLADLVWGPEGAAVRSGETARSIVATRKHLSDLRRMVQLTRRKFDAFGNRGSIARWWPEVPVGFPGPGDVHAVIRRIERQLPEVQHEQIRFEQQRSHARKLGQETLLLLAEAEDGDREELQRIAQNLLNRRRELLDELIQSYGRYSNQLTELDAVVRQFAAEEEHLSSFLYERLLWVRSVPRPILPHPTDIGQATGWLFSREHVTALFRAFGAALWRHPGLTVAVALLFGLLLGLRRTLRSRLAGLADRVAPPETDSFWATLRALANTLLLAAPGPLALYVASKILLSSDGSTFIFATGKACYYVAGIAGVLSLTRHYLTPRGLAEAHFGWPARITRPVYRGLFWRTLLFLPPVFVAVQLAYAGMKLDSPETLQVYNNSLGRLAFIAGLGFIGLSLLGLFRPRKQDADSKSASPYSWQRRLYLYAYPVVVLAAIVPPLLAAFGYYITGFLLAYQMLRTIWLGLALAIIAGLLLRWRTAGRVETGANPELADAQVRRLSRFAIILLAAFGLLAIWSDAVPTLQIVKRVQIFPRIALIETTDSADASDRAEGATVTERKAEGESGTTPSIPGLPTPSSGAADAGGPSGGSPPLTLWNLIESIIALLVTVVLVRNVPGLLELTLRRRTTLDVGGRVAIATLVRYAILIIGVTATFSLLGVSWSKVQWLAAALTFGLGFGLQEIVANFVSGLILLTERPVRVGDAVTVGNLQGRVSRIQIRATTISLWDQSEMIVPNKEFITTKLINWTLSDSRRRIDIPLRVAYGADLKKVKEILLDVARKHPDVFEDPPPQALLLEFGDDAIRFELRYFVDFGMGLRTRDEIHVLIDEAFRKQGISFALPHLNIQIPRRGAPPPTPPADGKR